MRPSSGTNRPLPAHTPRKSIPCAVLGTGRIGSSLETDRLREKPASHAGAISHHPLTFIAGGADPDPARLQAFGALWKLPQAALFDDPARLLAEIRPRIVHIAADTDAHLDLLGLCLDSKVPVIVLEKPLGPTLEAAQAMTGRVEAAEAAGTSRLVINHERRFAADYRKARDIIASKRFGNPLSMDCKLFMGRTRSADKVLWHDGTHLVDIIRFLAGPWQPLTVSGSLAEGSGPVVITGKTTPPSREGAPGTESPSAPGQSRAGSAPDLPPAPVAIAVQTGPGRDHLAFELDLGFERGRVRIGNGIYEEWESEPSRFYEQFRSLRPLTRPGANPFKDRTGYFARMMDHAVRLALDPALPGESTWTDGLAALETLQAIRDLAPQV